MKIDPGSLDRKDSHNLLVDIVLPRPIAWVSTVDAKGIFNLAPFSAFGMISTRPMVVGLAIGTKRDGQKKDTLLNIEQNGEFVINVVTKDLAEKMNVTSTPFPHDVSEFEKAGLTPVKADIVKAPMVAESPVNLECCVLQTIEFGKPHTNTLIIGEVRRVHIRDKFYNSQTKRVAGLNTIARLGADLYCTSQDVFELERPY